MDRDKGSSADFYRDKKGCGEARLHIAKHILKRAGLQGFIGLAQKGDARICMVSIKGGYYGWLRIYKRITTDTHAYKKSSHGYSRSVGKTLAIDFQRYKKRKSRDFWG